MKKETSILIRFNKAGEMMGIAIVFCILCVATLLFPIWGIVYILTGWDYYEWFTSK